MRFSRLALLLWILCFTPLTVAWAQSDPLQDANQLFRQGQFDRAMERVNSYLATRPKDARGRFLKGLILTEQNKPAEAIKVFTELSQDFPELPEPYNNLAVLYASQGQYDRARNALEMAIRTHPSYATAHENLGDIYAKMASQAYDKALQLDRSNQPVQSKLNLIKDLFSPTAPTGKPPAKVASAKVEVTPVQPPASVPAAALKPPAAAAAAPPPAAKAAPMPDAVAAAKPAPPAAAGRDTDDVLRAVNAWAHAWAANDIPGYLTAYAPDFQPPKGMSRSAWESERQARIAKPRKIEVSINSPKVSFDEKNNQASVTFRQHYKSPPLDQTSTKTLIMVNSGEKWLIQQERVGN